MKTLPAILSICLTFLTLNLFGQITIVSTDLTSIGDVVTRYTDTIPTYGPGGAGANQTWDFSGAIQDTLATTSVVTTASTPFASTFNGSDYAMTGDGNSFLYFTHNGSNMITQGAAGDLLGTGEIIEAPFSNSLILHLFPRTYAGYFNDTYEFEAEADGAAFGVYRIRLTHSGHVYDTTDAFGTLITPTGTYDALRVKTTDYTTDVVEVQLSQFLPIWTNFTTVQDTSITYSWHTKEEKLAIAEFAYDSIGNPARFTWSSVPPVVTTGIADAGSDSVVVIYPQPAKDQVFFKGISTTANVIADVYSINGSLINSQVLTSNSLNVAYLRSGMYFVQLRYDDGTRVEPLKFVVQ